MNDVDKQNNSIVYTRHSHMPITTLHTSSNSAMIEDDDLLTPKAPRGKRSDLTEKDLEEFTQTFSAMMFKFGHLE